MSIVQPENGLPGRRVITADSFRLLKLRLSGGHRPLTPAPPPEVVPPATPATVFFEPAGGIESLPNPYVAAASETIAELSPPEPAAEDSAAPTGEAMAENPAFEIFPEAHVIDSAPAEVTEAEPIEAVVPARERTEPVSTGAYSAAPVVPVGPTDPDFVERRVLEKPQPEAAEAGERAHALLDIMAMPTSGSLPQERALANDTLLRLIPRMPLKSLRHLADRVCMMEVPSEMLVRRLINDPRIEVSGPLLENAMSVHDSDLIALANTNNPAKLKLMARRRIISPALSEALIKSNHVETLLNLVRNQGAAFSIESMWRLARLAAAHPVLQAPLVTRQDTPSPIAFQLFWRLPTELRRYVLSRFLTDSETITKILSMNMEAEGTEQKYADLSLLSKLEDASPQEAGEIFSRLTHVSEETGARIADDAGGEALTVALKAAGLTRAQFAGIIDRRPEAEALKAIFETLSFNKARVLLTYWDWAARRTGPYARTVAA
jgi:uncharacterized protein (DUF2336 family)